MESGIKAKDKKISLAESLNLTYSMDKKIKKQNFMLLRGQCGYDIKLGDFFVTPFAVLGGAFDLKEQSGYHMNLGLGVDVGIKRDRFALYIGAGVVASNVLLFQKLHIKAPPALKVGTPSFFESMDNTKSWAIQPFGTACLKYKVSRDLHLTLRYCIEFNSIKSDMKKEYLIEAVGPVYGHMTDNEYQALRQVTIEGSLRLFSHTMLMGIEYAWKGM